MKGFDLRSSAVNLRAPGSSHRPGIKSKSRTTSFYLDIRSGGVVVTKTEGNDEFV